MKITKPKLKKSSKIGIVSLSQSLRPEYVKLLKQAAINFEKEFDVTFEFGEHAFDEYFYMPGKPEVRMLDFNNFVEREDIDGIFMSIGGGAGNHLLDLLNFDLIEKNPKVYAGISDSTNILVPITENSNIVTFYGLEFLKNLGEGISEYDKLQIRTQLFGEEGNSLIPDPNRDFVWGENPPEIKDEKWEIFKPGKGNGQIYAGVLGNFVQNYGATRYGTTKNKIIFLEGLRGDSKNLHRQLQGLKHRGFFDDVNGLVIGLLFEHYHSKATDKYYRPLKDIVLDVLPDADFPIIQIPDLGHGIHSLILPIGEKVTIDTETKQLLSFENK